MPQNIVTTIDPSVHTRMRRLLSSSFTEKSLRSQEPLIESYTDLLITRLRGLATAPTTKGNGVVINVVDWLNYFTVDIIGDLALGESFNCLENSNYHPWVETLNNFLKGMIYAAATRFYPSLEYLFMKMLPKSVMELQRKHAEFVSERINRRLNLEKDRPDFMTPFIKVNADFQQMSLKEIESNFAILIVAGADTTATTLSGTISYLLQTPSAMQKLVSEIRTSFKNEADITVAATKDLPYLDAVINEGLRLCNPVPGGLPRIVQEGGDTFAGHFVPEGVSVHSSSRRASLTIPPTQISVSIRPYVVSRSERYFAHPDSFIPERWFPLGKRPAEFESDHLYSSNPFSLGHSGCLGKNLAWAEMRIFMARLLWAFDLEEEEGKRVDWTKLKTLVIVQKEPVEVRIKVRKGVEGK